MAVNNRKAVKELYKTAPPVVAFDDEEWRFVIELFDLGPNLTRNEIYEAFSRFSEKGIFVYAFSSTALVVFSSVADAEEGLKIEDHRFSSRRVKFAADDTMRKIFQLRLHYSLKPVFNRPLYSRESCETSKNLTIGLDILDLSRSVDMVSVVEALSDVDLSLEQRVDKFVSLISWSDEQRRELLTVVSRLEDCFKRAYPECKVTPFGSFATDLGFRGSDLDVLLDPGSLEAGSKSSVDLVNEGARLILEDPTGSFVVVRKVRRARVPVLRLFASTLGVSIDVSFRNRMGVCNSLLLKSYLDACPVVGRVLQVVRWWAKVRDITGSPGCLTSHALSWLVVFFFMVRRRPPRLPPIVDVIKVARVSGTTEFVDGWECCGVVDIQRVPGWEPCADPPNLNVADLLRDLFTFFVNYDFGTTVVSPFAGKAIPRVLFGNEMLSSDAFPDCSVAAPPPGLDPLPVDSIFVIQDPLILNLNNTRHCSLNACEKFASESKKSLHALTAGMETGTPQEGVFSLLQLAVGDGPSRQFGGRVYNSKAIPRSKVKGVAQLKGSVLSYSQYPAVETSVLENLKENPLEWDEESQDFRGLPSKELVFTYVSSWRRLSADACRSVLSDVLLFRVAQLDPRIPDEELDATSSAFAECCDELITEARGKMSLPPEPLLVEEERERAVLERKISTTDSFSLLVDSSSPRKYESLADFMTHLSEIGESESRHALDDVDGTVSKLFAHSLEISEGTNGVIARFYCEADWPTFLARKKLDLNANKMNFLEDERVWSSVMARAAGDSRCCPRLGYLVELAAAEGTLPFEGLVIRCSCVLLKNVTEESGDKIVRVISEGSLAKFLRDGVVAKLHGDLSLNMRADDGRHEEP